jgi:hypothetical protein
MRNIRPPIKECDPLKVVLDTLADQQGIAIGEHHGEVSTMEFLTEHMKDFKKAGVTKFFIEMIPSRHSAAVKHFNETGEYDVEFPVNPHLGEPVGHRREVANISYALNEWNNKRDGTKDLYIKMIQEARRNGIEVIGMDGHEGAGRNRMRDSNPHWAAVIQENTADLKPGEKYMAYGGYYHFTSFEIEAEKTVRVNHLVEPPIPSIRFDSCKYDKPYVISQPNVREADKVVLLPESPHQPREGWYSRQLDRPAYEELMESFLAPKSRGGV